MANYLDFYKKLPITPSYEAIWAPVYLEPMMGSGEKFTVAIAAYGMDGKIRVCQAIRPHVIKAMYGNKHNNFSSLISLIISSLEEHIQVKSTLTDWISPISGAHLGKVSSARSGDMTGILRQAVQLTASLSSLDFFSSDDENDERYSSENTWSNQLKSHIVSSHPALEPYFNREFKIVGEARASKIFYLSDKIAVNTDRLIPSQLSSHLDRNKARILDLLAVRDYDIFERSVYEFIVYRPHEEDPTYSKAQFSKLKEALRSIEEIGDKHQVRVVAVSAIPSASKRIIEAEMQAA